MTNNSTGRSLTTDEYTTKLIYLLRMKNMPGSQIGEIIAEIEAHVAESGESAQDAFGDPAEYADARVGGRRFPGRWGRIGALPGILVAAVGGFCLATGFSAGLSHENVWGVNGWWVAVIGALLWFGVFCVIPIDAIVDPRRGGTRFGRLSVMLFTAGTAAVVLGLITVVHLLRN